MSDGMRDGLSGFPPPPTVPGTREIKVLDHGFVRLDDCMANDLSVVNSARVSFATRHEHMEDGDKGLINYLMKNHHGTPFEHNSFRFHVKAPLFIFREWQRHRIGSFNEWSARYSKLEPDWYIPDVEDVRRRVEGSRPGHYQYELVEERIARIFIMRLQSQSATAYHQYESALELGIAPEQARMFLPVNIYSQMYWTVNARSMMNFLSLRNSEHAQWEIQEYARQVEYLFSMKMPATHMCFCENERVAP